MNVFLLTLLFITAAPYAGADTIFNEKMSFNTAKAVKLGRGGGTSGWTNATIVTATRAVDADKTCMAHCAACNTKTGQCSKCEDGYWMEGGSCNLCSDFLENCAVCDASGSTCTKCFDGYKLTGGSCTGGSCEDGYWWDDWELACFACPADCKTCSDDATCESCFDGYYHDMDRCVPCSQNCKQCNYNGCTQCESGYELNNGKCSQITCEIANCNSCSKDGKSCLKCKDGYEKNENGVCKEVEKPEHCIGTYTQQTDGSYKCSLCETGYTGAKCDSCASGYSDTRSVDSAYFKCLKCSASNLACETCVVREFKTPEGTEYQAQCDTCPDGYDLVCEQTVQMCKVSDSYEIGTVTYKGACKD